MSYLDTPISYYPASVYETVPLGTCTLAQMLEAIRNPKLEILAVFKKIEEASKSGNKKLKDELKAKLFYFSPCVTTDGKGRKYENITGFNGLMLVDVDNVPEDSAVEIKNWLFKTYPCIIASFLSASKRGIKCIVRIPVVEGVDKFKALFYGLASELQYLINFDGTSQNPMLPNYLTYDRDILIRKDAVEWTTVGYKEDEFKEWSGGEIVPLEDVTEEDRQQIIRIVTRMVDKIVDSGHAFIRSASVLLWGYCGAGYFDEEETKEILFDLVDNNPYLNQKPRVYKRTCLDMKRIGSGSPVYLERHEHLYEN